MSDTPEVGDRVSFLAEGVVVRVREPNDMRPRGWLVVEDDNGEEGGMFLDEATVIAKAPRDE